MRFELDVVGRSVEDVVKNAGGRLFDRARAGWDVTVLIPECHERDVRPLRILGVQAVDLDATLAGPLRSPTEYIVAAPLFVEDTRVRARLVGALISKMQNVTMWGERFPRELDRRLVAERGEMSSAARAFKVHALAACGIASTPDGIVENFRGAAPIALVASRLALATRSAQAP